MPCACVAQCAPPDRLHVRYFTAPKNFSDARFCCGGCPADASPPRGLAARARCLQRIQPAVPTMPATVAHDFVSARLRAVARRALVKLRNWASDAFKARSMQPAHAKSRTATTLPCGARPKGPDFAYGSPMATLASGPATPSIIPRNDRTKCRRRPTAHSPKSESLLETGYEPCAQLDCGILLVGQLRKYARRTSMGHFVRFEFHAKLGTAPGRYSPATAPWLAHRSAFELN